MLMNALDTPLGGGGGGHHENLGGDSKPKLQHPPICMRKQKSNPLAHKKYSISPPPIAHILYILKFNCFS